HRGRLRPHVGTPRPWRRRRAAGARVLAPSCATHLSALVGGAPALSRSVPAARPRTRSCRWHLLARPARRAAHAVPALLLRTVVVVRRPARPALRGLSAALDRAAASRPGAIPRLDARHGLHGSRRGSAGVP